MRRSSRPSISIPASSQLRAERASAPRLRRIPIPGRNGPGQTDPVTTAPARSIPPAPVVARPEQPAAVPPTLPPTTTATVTQAPSRSRARNGRPDQDVEPPARTEQAPPPVNGPVVATAPVSAPVQRERVPHTVASTSPLGIWQTEKKEGLVRIEACGNNLCGYSVNAKTNHNGDQVLINMKPTGDKWTGPDFADPKSGGDYDTTIALKSPSTLRVQGCAFGGMFCGSQTGSGSISATRIPKAPRVRERAYSIRIRRRCGGRRAVGARAPDERRSSGRCRRTRSPHADPSLAPSNTACRRHRYNGHPVGTAMIHEGGAAARPSQSLTPTSPRGCSGISRVDIVASSHLSNDSGPFAGALRRVADAVWVVS